MRVHYIFIIIILPNLLFGQNPLEVNRTEYLYEVNPKDTTEKILTNIYIQDSCGNDIEFTEFKYEDYVPFEEQFSNENKIIDKGYRRYLYKENCKPVKVTVLDRKEIVIKEFLYNFDKNGNVKELKIIDSKGKQTSRYSYQYNTDNKLVKEVRFDNNDKADHITTIEYADNLKSKEIREHKDFNDTLICNYIYNINGQLVMEEWSNTDGSQKEYEMSVYQGVSKVKELFIDSESGDIDEYRMTYYANGLEKTWSEHDFIIGEIIRMTFSKYEFKK